MTRLPDVFVRDHILSLMKRTMGPCAEDRVQTAAGGIVDRVRVVDAVYDLAANKRKPSLMTDRERGIIQIALAPGVTMADQKQVQAAELEGHRQAFEFARDEFLTGLENEVLNEDFAVGSELNWRVADALLRAGNRVAAEVCSGDAREAAAYGYGLWAQSRVHVEESTRSHSLLARVKGVYRDVAAYISDVVGADGVKSERTVEGIFSALYDKGRWAVFTGSAEAFVEMAGYKPNQDQEEEEGVFEVQTFERPRC